MIVYNYDLDMVPGGAPVVVHLSQYDDDFRIVFKLFSSQGTLTIPDGTTAEMRGTKLDGNGFSANNVALSGNNATVYGYKQITAVAGKNTFEIALVYDGHTLSTANFVLDVEKAALDAGTIKSNTVLKELNDIINSSSRAITAASRAESALAQVRYAIENIDGTIAVGGVISGQLEPNNGLTVLWKFVVPLGILSIYIRGTLTGELATSSGYVSLGTMSGISRYMTRTVLKAISYNTGVRGQLNISTGGTVQLGYARRNSDDIAYDLPSGHMLYIQETVSVF